MHGLCFSDLTRSKNHSGMAPIPEDREIFLTPYVESKQKRGCHSPMLESLLIVALHSRIIS